MLTSSNTSLRFGRLNVSGPHWTAQLNVFDHQFQNVLQGVGEIEKTVPAGIYEVEAVVGSRSERQMVTVRPDRTASVHQTDWTVKLDSATPISGSLHTHEWHEYPAQDVSRRVTFSKTSGSSRFFLFLRSLDRESKMDFARGLRLYNAQGEVVTDFKEGVEVDRQNAWLGFTADLPPGGYVLGYARRGVRMRWQALWLADGWETQLFIPAGGGDTPYLDRADVHMSRKGQGFTATNDQLWASEAVLAAIQQGVPLSTPQSRLQQEVALDERVVSPQMEELLMGKFNNPWLGILSAYGLQQAGQGPEPLLYTVLNNLQSLVPGHPDLQALKLQNEIPANGPFPFPPMLYAGLRRVQEHSLLHFSTVHAESLTVKCIESIIVDGPWTAWHNPVITNKLDSSLRPARFSRRLKKRANTQLASYRRV